MLILPHYIVFIGLTIWGLFNAALAGWIFFFCSISFVAWLWLTANSLKSNLIAGLSEDSFTFEELEIFQRYAFYFIYPFQAKQYSGTCSLIQMLCFIWACFCLWNHEWGLIVAIISLLLAATHMAPLLNQGNFLRHHHLRGKLSVELIDRLKIVEAVENKVMKARGI